MAATRLVVRDRTAAAATGRPTPRAVHPPAEEAVLRSALHLLRAHAEHPPPAAAAAAVAETLTLRLGASPSAATSLTCVEIMTGLYIVSRRCLERPTYHLRLTTALFPLGTR